MSPTQALGWAIVHSLWQGALAATALASLFTIVPARAARTRYALAVATLLLMLAAPVGTTLQLRDAAPGTADPTWISAVVARTPARALIPGATVERPPRAPLEVAPVSATPALAERFRAAFEPALPWVVALWFSGVVLLSLRLASGWLMARRLGTVGTRPAPPACTEALARLAARLRVTQPVRVFESAVVQVPAMIGWLRPVVLLPASALTGLTPLQLDALLAHELAHVRRYDYVVNLVQSVIETLLFYHPAVWWVSRRVREEREHCCDDLAIAACGDAYVYASALVGMEGLRVPTPAFAVAAGGGSLLSRIRRILAAPTAEIFPRWIAGLAAATLALTIGGGAGLAGATAGIPEPTVQRASGVPASFARHASHSSTDSLIARVRSLRDAERRREAVKRLGKQGGQGAVAALIEIARDDHDEDVQGEAVERLGKMKDGSGLHAVIDFARTHPNPDVRREAVDAIREAAAPAVAIEVLQEIARRDADSDVQEEALEGLGELADARDVHERTRREP
jgi:bla regulator protein blaR1